MNAFLFVLSAHLQASTMNVADYFPLDEGTRWTYQQDSDGTKSTTVYTVGKAVKVGRGLGTPISISDGRGGTTTLYYRIVENTVFLLGTDTSNPLQDPQPMIRLSGTSDKWGYDYLSQGEPVNVNAHVTIGEKRSVLGRQRDVIELNISAVLGGGDRPFTQMQRAYYAKGIGLVEWDTEQSVGRQKRKLALTLVKYEPAASIK